MTPDDGRPNLIARYDALAAAGQIVDDPAQRAVAAALNRLGRELALHRPARAGGLLGRLVARPTGPTPRGLYIHGGVGRGKTMLMDLFFDNVPVTDKLRRHFHGFMADVHEAIGEARKTEKGDPIPSVGQDIARRARLLCFDEFHVTDIADAMILARLCEALFAHGVVMVATSNQAPSDLYRDGLNRALFLPAIAMLEANLDVMELDADRDYRLEKLSGQQLYVTPADRAGARVIDQIWQRLTGGQPATATRLEVKGRVVVVPAAAMGVARFPFAELCERPLGAIDYLAIAERFHTVIIEGVPQFSAARRDSARRFIHLIDTLYDAGICLIVSADAEPDALYPTGPGADLFQRTASRLIEMRSAEYLARSRRAGVQTADGGAG